MRVRAICRLRCFVVLLAGCSAAAPLAVPTQTPAADPTVDPAPELEQVAPQPSGDRAVLLLDRSRAPRPGALRGALHELGAADLAPAEEVPADNPLTYTLPGGGEASLRVTAAPMARLAEQLERLSWPLAERDRARAHTAQLEVRLDGLAASPIERKLALTRLTSAVMRVTGAAAVYWPDTGAVHRPATFTALAEDAAAMLPVRLWVSLRIDRGDTVRVRTHGMKALGRPELVITAPEGRLERAVAACFDWAQRIVVEPSDTPPSAVFSSSDLLRIQL